MPHRRKARVLDQEINLLLVDETNCNISFMLSSIEEKKWMDLISCGSSSVSYVVLTAEAFHTLH